MLAARSVAAAVATVNALKDVRLMSSDSLVVGAMNSPSAAKRRVASRKLPDTDWDISTQYAGIPRGG
jgi:hypothetical protein